MATSSSKKSFDFRMSKKVAELTQVVHMLFTRNHEKEVELEAYKDAYEYEIDIVIQDAKGKIDELNRRLNEYENKTVSDNSKEMEQEYTRREEEWKKKIANLETQLQEEKKECQNARDLLIQAQMDIEKLRDGQSTEVSRWNTEIDLKNSDMERLKAQVEILENKIKESESKHTLTISELQKTNAKLHKENFQVKELLSETERFRDQVLSRNKQMENDIRILRKELERKDRSLRNSATSRSSDYRDLSNATLLEYAEEIDRLRRQVHLLKNELSNRENNFNRMFTEQNPVTVDRRGSRRLSLTGTDPNMPHLRYSRDKNITPLGGSSQSISAHLGTHVAPSGKPGTVNAEEVDIRDISDGQMTLTRVSSASSGSRLPNLGLDLRMRGGNTIRLAKPKPLPKEMISTKVGSQA